MRDLGLQSPFQNFGLVVLIADLLQPARHPREEFSREAAALIHRTEGGFAHYPPLVASTTSTHLFIDILLDLLDPLRHLLVLLVLGLPHELLSDGLHFLLDQLL